MHTNGTTLNRTDPTHATPTSQLSLIDRKTELEIKILEQQARVMESVLADDYAFGGSDLMDDLRRQVIDADGTRWAPINIPNDRKAGANWPLWRDEQSLGSLRQKSRVLVGANSFAGGLLRNLTSHVIGKGGTYKAKPIKDAKPPMHESGKPVDLEALAADVQAVIDDHCKRNRWNCGADPRINYQAGPTREQEIFRRTFRDGESIIRAFFLKGDEGDNEDDKGRTFWRFVEPSCVKDPPGATPGDGWFMGMQHRTHPYEDTEDIQNYYAIYLGRALDNAEQRDEPNGEEIPAKQIVHVTNPDEDSMIGRGTPFFAFDTFDAFYRAGRLQRAISIGATIRACTAEMWEHQVATAAQITSLAAGQGKAVQNPQTGQTEYSQIVKPGAIRHGPASRKLVPPVPGGVNEHLDACQGDLRQAASAACAPEYMVSADASNANYSSTKEAGTPFVRYAELLQEHFKTVFLCCIWKAVRWAIECGKLAQEALDLIEITCELPKVTQRDPLQSAQEDQILIEAGIKDRQTASAERGLDPDDVEQNNQEWQEANGQQTGGMQLPPAGGASPFGQPPPTDAQPPIGVTESKDASGHEHAEDGKFGSGSGGGKKADEKPAHGSRAAALAKQHAELKQARIDTFNAVKTDAMKAKQDAETHVENARDTFNSNIGYGDDDKAGEPIAKLDELLSGFDDSAPIGERFDALKEIEVAAGKCIGVGSDAAENEPHLKAIAASARAARQSLKAYVEHRKEMQAIKSGESIDVKESMIDDGNETDWTKIMESQSSVDPEQLYREYRESLQQKANP